MKNTRIPLLVLAASTAISLPSCQTLDTLTGKSFEPRHSAVNMVSPTTNHLILADGSQWEIAPINYVEFQRWNAQDPVRLMKGTDAEYRYLLLNLRTHESVHARQKGNSFAITGL